jgi:hypothetical protein
MHPGIGLKGVLNRLLAAVAMHAFDPDEYKLVTTNIIGHDLLRRELIVWQRIRETSVTNNTFTPNSHL